MDIENDEKIKSEAKEIGYYFFNQYYNDPEDKNLGEFSDDAFSIIVYFLKTFSLKEIKEFIDIAYKKVSFPIIVEQQYYDLDLLQQDTFKYLVGILKNKRSEKENKIFGSIRK